MGTAQVLVLGQLAGYRNGDRWFTLEDILQQFEDLRVPTPDVKRALRQLVETGRVRPNRPANRWSLTPVGNGQVTALMGDLDPARLEPLLVQVGGAEFGHARHTVIPHAFAPVRWQAGIQTLVDRFPFETNVFCMTRFPDKRMDDPIDSVVSTVRDALDGHGLLLLDASQRTIDDDLWGNVAAHGWACRYGVALFEDRANEGLNDNMIIEIGAMLMTGRRCALLRDKSVPKMPTDLVGQIYKPVDFDDQDLVSAEIHKWAAEDLGFGACPKCPRK